MTERHASRCPVLVQPLAQFEEACGVLGELLEARLFTSCNTVIDESASGRDRDTDPLVSGLAIILRRLGPAAVLAAEIVRDIGDIGDLVAEQMRQRVEAPDHVEALP